jgi:hypothetical protein
MSDSRIELLERRMTTAESDVADRHVSQYAAEQARRGTDALPGLRSEVAALRADLAGITARVDPRIDALAENVAAINSMISRHGRALEVVMQDVRLIRQEATERHEITNARFDQIGARLDTMEKESTARHEITNARFDQMHAELMAAIASLRPS